MTDNNSIEIISELTDTNIKEELYILYLEIKGEISKRCIEINKSTFDENVSNFKIKTLLNYLKEIIYILLNNKFKINQNIISKENKNNENNIQNTNISQLENEIKKYQADIRYLIKKQFQYRIQKDAMEIKLNSYMEMEKEYDLLKEKVKYEEGRFLNNDRKDNEILILREENSNLKKEIIKNEKNSKNYELKIKNEQIQIRELKSKLNQLNKKLILLETNQISNVNNFSTIHNNSTTNGRTSSRWRKKEKEDKVPSNSSNINSYGNHSIKKKKKILNTKYSKLEMKGINNLITIDNNSLFNETYNKILNSLVNFKNNNNMTSKKTIAATHKKNSISMCVENDKVDENSKHTSNRNSKNKYGSKHKIYNKLINGIPNSKFPLTSKHYFNKNLIPSLPQKYFIKNNSFLNLKGKTKESFHVE